MSWPVAITGFFLLFGLFVLTAAVNGHRRTLQLIDQPTTTTRAAAVGLTEVTGRAVPVEESFPSPFQERPSVLAHYAFYGRLGPNQDGNNPPRDTGTLGVPFYVEDDTGRILVRPEGAEIRLPSHLTAFTGDKDRIEALAPAVTERFKDRRRSGNWPALDSTRASVAKTVFKLDDRTDQPRGGPSCGAEMRLEEGESVYVIGHARPREASAADQPSSAEDASELVISTKPGTGGSFDWAFGVFPYLSGAYGSIFEIYKGTEEDLRAAHRREMWKGILMGFSFFLIGLLGLLWILQPSVFG
jgi:hypothetical protein